MSLLLEKWVWVLTSFHRGVCESMRCILRLNTFLNESSMIGVNQAQWSFLLDYRLEITSLLSEKFYVPLLRCHDNSKQPLVAPPWTPDRSVQQSEFFVYPCSPQDPVPVITAVAGPMTSKEADDLRRHWTTPNKKVMEGITRFLVFSVVRLAHGCGA